MAVPTLQITEPESGQFRGRVTCDEEVLGEIHEDSLAAVIRVAAGDWGTPVEAMHIWFDHVSVGTIPRADMHAQADALAQQLLELRAAIEDDSC
ncbi:hypothetical protein AAV94_01105 [Lampropedia cohaerens]|uniref:Uncharacterized protein n=1 Tax=Lampropedia cohaerens TaxID=1610491 RepID=A0A0U1Q2R4_9BURK|nr:hypothetical protein [Lampropedia cohaerens]KKW69040.1 hypothetical protein AAV94_01105 [Lampropedia cohaerens]